MAVTPVLCALIGLYIDDRVGTPPLFALAFAMFVNNTHIEKASDTAREGKTLGRLCEIIIAER